MKIRRVVKPTHLTDIVQIIYGNNESTNTEVVRKGRPKVVSGVHRVEPINVFTAFGTILDQPDTEERDYYDVITDTPTDRNTYVETEFPDEPEEEGLPYNGIVADNEFIVDPEEVSEVRIRTAGKESVMRQMMIENLALLYGMEDASNYVEAMARDSLDMPIERDPINEDAFVPLIRLNTILTAASTMSGLKGPAFESLTNHLTELTAQEIIQAYRDGRQKVGLDEMRKHYASTLSKSGLKSDSEEDDFNSLGVRASRGTR